MCDWLGGFGFALGGDPLGADAPALARCCAFLLSKQQADGGWGESYLSCLTKQYAPRESQVVMTAWALLALCHAQCPAAHAVRRGVDFLIARQAASGDWAQEDVSGIFNRTCSITYTAYRNVFPLWALGCYVNSYRYRLELGVGVGAGAGALPAASPAVPALPAEVMAEFSRDARGLRVVCACVRGSGPCQTGRRV